MDIADPTASHVAAGRGTRLGAAFLDGIIGGLMVWGPFTIGLALGGVTSDDPSNMFASAAFMVFAAVGLIGLVAWCWLTYRFAAQNGQTIAKKMLGIKVVRRDGSRVSVARLFWLRNVVNGLLGIIPLYGLIDVLFIFGEARECVHDKLADTMVVTA